MKQLLLIVIFITLAGCAGAPPNIFIPKKQPPPFKLKKRPDVALVLGAGGARGFAHAGVVKVLQDAGVPINLIIGSSVGSFYGALLADSGNADKAADIMLSATFWDIADIANLPSLKGPMSGYRYEKFLLKHMHAKWFRQLKIPLVIATTNLTNGHLYAISGGPIAPAAKASASIPGAVQPSEIYGKTLIDGGMVDPVPVDIAQQFHPKMIIAVNIDQQLPRAMPVTAFGIYDRGYHISWLQLARLAEEAANIVIRPNVGDVGTFDISKKNKLFREGERAAKRALPAIKALLKQKHIALHQVPKSQALT